MGLTILLMSLGRGDRLRFAHIRPLAGWLLVPYLAWLCLATALNFEIDRLNPGSDSAPLGYSRQIMQSENKMFDDFVKR